MSKWFKKYRYQARARVRLFCFPYAGGSARIFAGWEKLLPASVDVFALEAPGRGVRMSEAPLSDLRAMTAIVADEIRPYLDVPYVFFGHSLGALAAFDLARELQARGVAGPRHLILSAKRAPHLPKRELIHTVPFDEFLERLRHLAATPAEVLGEEDLMRLYEPMLRADFALSETYQPPPGTRIHCPVTLFGGEADPEVPKEDLLAWREHLAGPVDVAEFPGGHFFIHSQREAVVAKVRTIVEDVAARE